MYWKNPVKIWRETGKRYRFLGKIGVLVSWTKIGNPPVSFAKQRNYFVGLVDFGKEGRFIAQLVGVNGEPRKGAKVEGVLRRLYEDGEDGVICYGTKFQVKGR